MNRWQLRDFVQRSAPRGQASKQVENKQSREHLTRRDRDVCRHLRSSSQHLLLWAMSLPQQCIPHSPSSQSRTSSKSSQRPSGNLLPSPHFEEAHLGRSLANEHAVEASAVAEELIPEFHPFFTLIETPATSEHHHPTVHYIFADDDAEIITEAACRALAQEDAQHTQTQTEEESKLPAPIRGVREHYLVLDVQPADAGSGFEATRAHSLSSEWQVLNATITNAPTIDGNASESGEGLMLKIEGTSAVKHTDSVDAGRKESLEQMVDRFEKGLMEIRKMIEAGQEK